jgi:hypothetical protein
MAYKRSAFIEDRTSQRKALTRESTESLVGGSMLWPRDAPCLAFVPATASLQSHNARQARLELTRGGDDGDKRPDLPAKGSARGHGAHIFSCRPGGANCLNSPRLKV